MSYILTSPIDIFSSTLPGEINLYDNSGSFAINLKSPSSLAGNIDFTLPNTTGVTGQFLERFTPTSLKWTTYNKSNTLPILLRTCYGNTPVTGDPYAGTAPSVGVIPFRFIYGGSGVCSIPKQLTILFNGTGATAGVNYLVRNSSGGVVIAGSISPPLSSTTAIYTTTTIFPGLVPPSQDIFEFGLVFTGTGAYSVNLFSVGMM